MQWNKILMVILLLLTFANTGQAEDCTEATRLAAQAYRLGEAPETFAEQKRLLTRALELCPQHPEVYKNLAWIFEQERAFEQALVHYQEAVRLNPDLAEARVGIGDVYYQTGKFTLSLEAYLYACEQDQDARDRIAGLLESNRYRVVDEGKILDQESLLLLFDNERRERINVMLEQCRFRDRSGSRAYMEPDVIFRNIRFDLGKARLKQASLDQLREIGAMLLELGERQVIIRGHTDKQWFKGVTSAEENLRRNMQLSRDRAASAADYLVTLGVPRSRIETYGYGPTQPLVDEDTQAAYAQNRRVEIEVR